MVIYTAKYSKGIRNVAYIPLSAASPPTKCPLSETGLQELTLKLRFPVSQGPRDLTFVILGQFPLFSYKLWWHFPQGMCYNSDSQ